MSRGLYKSLEEVTGIDQVNIKLINFAVQEVCEIIVYKISHLKFHNYFPNHIFFQRIFQIKLTLFKKKHCVIIIIINHL